MSVYTTVSTDTAERFLVAYEVGELAAIEGITAGIENTNYFVDTVSGRFVLTLFERHEQPDLEYFLSLMTWLADAGLPCPRPIPARDGSVLRWLEGRHAALVERLPGRMPQAPDTAQCAELGRVLGRLHAVGQGFAGRRRNERGTAWRADTAQVVRPYLEKNVRLMLDQEVAWQAAYPVDGLPRGAIHADLFRDNALYDAGRLTGVIDFYAACHDLLLYDLAICVNDWCVAGDGSLDGERGRALMSAYAAERPLQPAERDAWPAMLRRDALRFWLSRLYDLHFPRAGEITHIKDPLHFQRILCHRIGHGPASLALWPAPQTVTDRSASAS